MTKTIAEFPKNSGKKDGVGSWCRDCNNALSRRWYAEHRARHNKNSTRARRARVKAGSTKERESRRRYWRETRGQLRPELASRLSDAKRRAAARDQEATITVDELVALWEQQRGQCALTGWAMSMANGGLKDPTCLSLDRIDNGRGYVVGNLRLVCWWVNKARGENSDARFVEMCRAVSDTYDRRSH